MKKYSVSGLFQKQNVSNVINELRVLITDANSKEEALGRFLLSDDIEKLKKQGFLFSAKVIIEINLSPK